MDIKEILSDANVKELVIDVIASLLEISNNKLDKLGSPTFVKSYTDDNSVVFRIRYDFD